MTKSFHVSFDKIPYWTCAIKAQSEGMARILAKKEWKKNNAPKIIKMRK